MFRSDRDRADGIRQFYLSPKTRYSLDELAELWSVPIRDRRQIFEDELTSESAEESVEVTWEQAVRAVRGFHIFRPIDIENALGDDLDRTCEDRWRTVAVLVHVPKWVVDVMLRTPFIPTADSVAERAERMLCDIVEAEEALRTIMHQVRSDR